jgi:hypothetical protein
MMKRIKIFLSVLLIVFACKPYISVGQSKFLKEFSIHPGLVHLGFPPSNSVSHIATYDSVIYIGTSNGLAKSINGGRSWTSFHSDLAFADNGIFAIATNKETVWVSTGYSKDVSGSSTQTGSGYTFSVNGDTGWHHLPQTLDQRGDSIYRYCIPDSICLNDSVWFLPVVVPEQNVTFDIALTEGSVWIASWASGLRKSTDNGATWQRILLPLDNMDTLRVTDTLWTYGSNDTTRYFKRYDPRKNNNLLAFSVYASGRDTIWCGTAGGINRSTDGGISWVKFNHRNQSHSILGNWIISIKEQRFNGIRRIWTTNWKAEDNTEISGVSYSDDDGNTWKNILHGVRAYDFAFKDSITYIASDEGIYRTDNGGKNFVRIANFTDTTIRQSILSAQVFSVAVMGDTVLLGTNEGFVRTIDNDQIPFGTVWSIGRTYEKVGVAAKTYAYPNPFQPKTNLNDPEAYIRIHYGLKNSSGSSDRKVSIDIFDFGMNRVRTLINNATRPSDLELDELWDARDDEGRIVANGVYFYTVKIDNEELMYGKILVLQ